MTHIEEVVHLAENFLEVELELEPPQNPGNLTSMVQYGREPRVQETLREGLYWVMGVPMVPQGLKLRPSPSDGPAVMTEGLTTEGIPAGIKGGVVS